MSELEQIESTGVEAPIFLPESSDKPAHEPDPDEVRASEIGWKPEGQYSGKHPWVPAKEYLARAPLFEKIKESKQEAAEVKKAFGEFQDKVNARFEAERIKERQRHEAELKAAHALAMESFDTEKASQIVDDLANLRAEEKAEEMRKADTKQEPKAPTGQEFPQDEVKAVDSWVKQNAWFTTDPILGGFANTVYAQRRMSHPNESFADSLAETRKEVVTRFQDKFQNPRQEAAPSVEGLSRGGKIKTTINDFPPEYRRRAEQYRDNGTFTLDEYASELRAMRVMK